MKLKNLGFAVVGLLLSAGALAAPIAAFDSGDLEDSFTNQIVPITAIVTVVLGLVALVKTAQWIKRAMG